MKKKRIAVAVAVISGVIALAVLGVLVYQIVSSDNASEEHNKIVEQFAPGTQTTSAVQENGAEATTQPLVENPVDFASLKQQNTDIYSWITIKDTQVNYPVVQSRLNDNFYLDHGIDKEYSFPGAIYSQLCNRSDYTDRVTVLYGHNMLDGSMFATLHKFEDRDFFDKHEYFYVYTERRRLTYRVVSAFVSDDSHIMNSHNFADDKVFLEFEQSVLNPHSLSGNVRDNVKLDLSDRLLVLSTCLDYGEGRYLVVGELTAAEFTK